MTLQTPVRFYGLYASPYTRKMLALLRFRHIPYQLLQGGSGDEPQDLPEPKVKLLPTFYFDHADGSVEAAVDSTPLIRRFEQAWPGRSVIPNHPVLAFLDYLLEDYGDEWLTKAMFHFRWANEADADQSSTILQMESNPAVPQAQWQQRKQRFSQRQTDRLYVVGSNDTTAATIEQSYSRFLEAFQQILAHRPFLLGQRPSAADFALYGQLTQLACFDPTPMALTLKIAPRVMSWVRYMDDLSGLEVASGGWCDPDEAIATLQPLLQEVGRTYVPVMLANADALGTNSEWVDTVVQGRPWRQRPFPYQGHCLQWIRERYATLNQVERHSVDKALDGTGCEALLQA